MSRDMTVLDLDELGGVVGEQPYPLLFATVSGAHLYGFPSRDSDVDLRGAHLLPAAEVVGLRTGPETLSRTWDRDGAEVDLVTHDLAKFLRLLLRRNGYVLEQLLSPLVVTTSAAHAELVGLAPACLTRHHADHYRGFATTQRTLFGRTGELKPLLYTLRVLLTGIHLMRSHETVADVGRLAGVVPEAPPYLADLVAAKRAGEHDRFEGPQDRVADDVTHLLGTLADAQAATSLPDAPSARPALHDLLVRLRLSAASA
jgi:hypothetical protein